MKNIFIFFLLISITLICYSQKSFKLTAGIGYAEIDIEALVEKDEIEGTEATDWSQFSGGVSGQSFFASAGSFGFGIELMFQHLYWYSVRVPFGTNDLFREYLINTFKITPIVRVGVDSPLAFDIEPEINFSDGTHLGLLMSGNYYIL